MKKTFIIIGTVLVLLITSMLIIYNVVFIGKSEVKEIVVNHAGIEMKDAKKWSIEFEYEDGMFVYDVDVVFDNKEYNYEINAKNGDIILYKLDN